MPDRAARCSVRDGSDASVRLHEEVQVAGMLEPAGSQDDPINLEEEEEEEGGEVNPVFLEETGEADDPIFL